MSVQLRSHRLRQKNEVLQVFAVLCLLFTSKRLGAIDLFYNTDAPCSTVLSAVLSAPRSETSLALTFGKFEGQTVRLAGGVLTELPGAEI